VMGLDADGKDRGAAGVKGLPVKDVCTPDGHSIARHGLGRAL
jgi:hypothetical protein